MTLISTRESREGFSRHLKDNKNSFPSHQTIQNPSQERPFHVPTHGCDDTRIPQSRASKFPSKSHRSPVDLGIPEFRDTPGNIPISACHPRKIPGLEVAPPSQALLLLLLPPTGQKSPLKFKIFCSRRPWRIHAAKISLNPRHPLPAPCSRRN